MTENLKETLFNKKIDTMNILSIYDAEKFLNRNPCIIVTGVSGQDGSYMVDYLLKNTTEYVIFGGVRRLSVYNHKNINHINDERFKLINFDLTDSHSIGRIIEKLKPSYFINFAAQSYVASSWDFARQTWQTNSTAVLDILEAIRQYNPLCRGYFAGSSEEFGNVLYSPQDENHPMRPRSPYGASKAAARQLVKVYRESYNLYVLQGALYNHESERRSEEFVTQKISREIGRIKKEILDGVKNIEPLELGNIYAKRDWSYAPDFIDGVWRMLNQEFFRKELFPVMKYDMNSYSTEFIKQLKEYILSSGKNYRVKDFVTLALKIANIDGEWIETVDPLNTTFVSKDDRVLVKINPSFYRPAEVDELLGNSSLARKELNWEPEVDFQDLVNRMVKNRLP